MKTNAKSILLNSWENAADSASVEKTIRALKANGISAYYFDDESGAKNKAYELIPLGSEVMTMTSVTLDELGISKHFNESGQYKSVRNLLGKMDRVKQAGEMQKLGAAPNYSIASAHAITQDGKIMIASATGSQLPAAAYGAGHVIFVVGTQKIVKNMDEGLKRIYEHTLPLESERAKKAYGAPGSIVGKMLLINKEFTPNRIHVIFLGKPIGF